MPFDSFLFILEIQQHLLELRSQRINWIDKIHLSQNQHIFGLNFQQAVVIPTHELFKAYKLKTNGDWMYLCANAWWTIDERIKRTETYLFGLLSFLQRWTHCFQLIWWHPDDICKWNGKEKWKIAIKNVSTAVLLAENRQGRKVLFPCP